MTACMSSTRRDDTNCGYIIMESFFFFFSLQTPFALGLYELLAVNIVLYEQLSHSSDGDNADDKHSPLAEK